MDFPEILLILLVAMIVLGPEKTIELATKLGEFLRKIRETWDELRYQMYLENLNKEITKQSEDQEDQEKSTLEYIEQVKSKEVKEDEPRTSENASDGASEGTKTKAD